MLCYTRAGLAHRGTYMSIKTKILFMCLLSIITFSAFADNCTVQGRSDGPNYHGNTKCSNVTLSSLTSHGNLTLSNTTIKGAVNIFGDLTASNVTAEDEFSFHGHGTISNLTANEAVDIHGAVTLTDSQLQSTVIHGTANIKNTTMGDTEVYGTSSFYNSKIKDNLTLKLDKAILNSTLVHNITVLKSVLHHSEILCLQKTHVTGYIMFASAKGTIYLSGDSKIDGPVTGAKQINGECPHN
jgi:hypothetical protein